MSNPLARDIHFSSLLRFAFPSIVMMVIMSLYTMVDGVFVANLINTHAFSAVNLVYPIMSVVIAIGTMLGTGICAIIAKKLGENKQHEANENLTFIVVFALVLGSVISFLCLLFLPQLIQLLGADKSVFNYCMQYAQSLLLFVPFGLVQLVFQNVFVANGKPNVGLLVTILGGIANIILDYVFIKYFHMGIAGAAIATGIGYMIPSIFGIFYFFFIKKHNFYFVKPKIDLRVLSKTLTNGSSEMVSNLSASVTTYLFNILMMKYMGADGVAAISIILYLDFLLIAISLGYAMGIAPIIAYNYGSKSFVKLHKIISISTRFSFGVGIAMCVGTFIFAPFLVSFFASEGIVFDIAVIGMRIFCFSYLVKGYNIFASALFTALSNGKISAILSFFRTFIFLTLFLLSFSAIMGMDGIWIAPVVAEICAITMSLYFILKKKKEYHY